MRGRGVLVMNGDTLETADLLAYLRDWVDHYPEDMFRPIERGEANPSQDRCAAHMARHVLRRIIVDVESGTVRAQAEGLRRVYRERGPGDCAPSVASVRRASSENREIEQRLRDEHDEILAGQLADALGIPALDSPGLDSPGQAVPLIRRVVANLADARKRIEALNSACDALEKAGSRGGNIVTDEVPNRPGWWWRLNGEIETPVEIYVPWDDGTKLCYRSADGPSLVDDGSRWGGPCTRARAEARDAELTDAHEVIRKMATAMLDAGQGCVTGDTFRGGDPVEIAEGVRDSAIALYHRVGDIYGDRVEGMEGAYGDAFDVIGAALDDLAIAYEGFDAASFDDGMEEAVANHAARLTEAHEGWEASAEACAGWYAEVVSMRRRVEDLQAEVRRMYAQSLAESQDASHFHCARCREWASSADGSDSPAGLCSACWCDVHELVDDEWTVPEALADLSAGLVEEVRTELAACGGWYAELVLMRGQVQRERQRAIEAQAEVEKLRAELAASREAVAEMNRRALARLPAEHSSVERMLCLVEKWRELGRGPGSAAALYRTHAEQLAAVIQRDALSQDKAARADRSDSDETDAHEDRKRADLRALAVDAAKTRGSE